MLKKLLIKTFYLLVVFVFSLFRSQSHTLDQLENITEQYRAKDDIQGAINFNKQALKQYSKANNIEGMVAAQLNIANYLSVSTNFKESMKYLDKSEKYISQINNFEIISKFHSCCGRNYSALELFEISNARFDIAINFAKRIENKKKRERRLHLGYSWKLVNFQKMQLHDSIIAMEKKCLSIAPDPFLYTTITRRFLEENKNLDSAEYYLDKASKIVDRYSLYEKAIVLFDYGRLFTEKKEYKKATDYYLSSLEILENSKNYRDNRDIYRFLAENYQKLNDKEKEAKYMHKYKVLNDSISAAEKKAIQIPLKKEIQEKEKQQKNEKYKLYKFFSIIILIFLFLNYYRYKILKKKQKQKEQLQQDQEAEKLAKQSNIHFEEIVQMAKTNDPFFLARFQEVYPNFIKVLTSNYPSLTANDIKFCAFLKLNLSNKQIMQYENLSIRTVETKKYRIRKKLGIASGVDINKWFMEL